MHEKIETMIQLRKRGLTHKMIGARYGLSEGGVRQQFKEYVEKHGQLEPHVRGARMIEALVRNARRGISVS